MLAEMDPLVLHLGYFLTTLIYWEAPDKLAWWETPQFSSVQFSNSVMSDSLQPHELQHARPPCPSPVPGVYSNSCPSSRWCHPAISSSVVPFSSCPQSLPASGSFPMSQLFTWGGQSIEVSALASVFPTDLPRLISFRMDWLDLLAVQGTPKSLVQYHSSKASILQCSAFFTVQLSHPYMTTGKTIALTRWIFLGKVMSLLFNMLSRLVVTFLSLFLFFVFIFLFSLSGVIIYIHTYTYIYIHIYIYIYIYIFKGLITSLHKYRIGIKIRASIKY